MRVPPTLYSLAAVHAIYLLESLIAKGVLYQADDLGNRQRIALLLRRGSNFGEITFRALRWARATKAQKTLELAANPALCHASSRTERRSPCRVAKRRKPKIRTPGVGRALGRSGTQCTPRRRAYGGSGRTTSATPGVEIEEIAKEISWCSVSRS